MVDLRERTSRRHSDADDRTWARGVARQSALVQVAVRLAALGLLFAVIAAAIWLTTQS